jgi:formiminoglutamase
MSEIRVSSWLKPWDPAVSYDAALLSATFSNADRGIDESHAPADVIRGCFSDYTTYSSDYEVDFSGLMVTDLGMMVSSPRGTDLRIPNAGIELGSFLKLYPHTVPIVVGGDHSITAATGKSFCDARRNSQIGLIYFDAHRDVGPMAEDSPPVGATVRALLQDCRNLRGSSIVEIGLHGFMDSPRDRDWAEENGIRTYTARAVRHQGMASILANALGHDLDSVDAIYASVDIDVLAQGYAIGTGGRTSPDGIEPNDLLDAAYSLGQNRKVAMLDVAEYDPFRDVRDLTGRVCCSIVLAFLAGMRGRG